MEEEFRYTNKFLWDKLMGEYTLSSKEYRICILVLLAFKPGEMVNLTGFSSSDISKTRQRLLMKLFGEQGSAGQFDKRLRGGIKWRVKSEERRVKNEKWRVKNEKWRVKNKGDDIKEELGVCQKKLTHP